MSKETNDKIQDVQKIFNALDSDKKGYITVEDFRNRFKIYKNTNLSNNEYVPDESNPGSSTYEIQALLDNMDIKSDGKIGFEDFNQAYEKFLTISNHLNNGTLYTYPDGPADYEIDTRTEDSGVNSQFYDVYSNQPCLSRGEIRSSWPKRKCSPFVMSEEIMRDGQLSPISYSKSDAADYVETHIELLQDQMRRMEHKVNSLDCMHTDNRIRRYEQCQKENDRLSLQLSLYEERLKDLESQKDSALEREKEHYSVLLKRSQSEYEKEIENLKLVSASYEKKYCDEKEIRLRAEAELATTHKELERQTNTQSTLQEQLLNVQSKFDLEHRNLLVELDIAKKERDQALKMIKDFNYLQQQQNSVHSSDSSPVKYQGLEEAREIIKQLTSDNRRLKSQIEELNEELLSQSVQQGKKLLERNATGSESDIEGKTEEELIYLLSVERNGNAQLRKYVEQLIERVIDKHPELLEIPT